MVELIKSFKTNLNKTGFQPVSMTCGTGSLIWRVDRAKSFRCQGFADRQPYRTSGGSRCIKVGTKVHKSVQNPTGRHTDR